MASTKNALAMCDICGFVYPHRLMQLNRYGLLVCPEDFDGQFDLKNNPQNKIPEVTDNPVIENPRSDYTAGRGIKWEQYATWITTDPDTVAETIHTTQWDDANRSWNTI